ncbi:hypothetical protein [Actinoplanes sp. NPDC051851]|uniref:hypothetical protein n=1 Tax=Actinoplanes sp. NPDC051851 TaxID=3154753 RepID=UPI00341EF98D
MDAGLLGMLAVIGVALFAGLAVLAGQLLRSRRWSIPRIRPQCLHCLGSGWIGWEPRRTLNFTGEGFEEVGAAPCPCPACRGTGRLRAPRR